MKKNWNDQFPHGLTQKRPPKKVAKSLRKKNFFWAVNAADRVQGGHAHGREEGGKEEKIGGGE